MSSKYSAGLGLIPGVLALISAPGDSMAALTKAVRHIAGKPATLISLRSQQQQQLPQNPKASGSRPASYLELFQESAARYCPGMSWTVLAAIGQIESGDGSNMGPSTAGALGPMQFLPSTWAEWGITAFGETGPPNIMDPFDAVPSAARLLCAAGGQHTRGPARRDFRLQPRHLVRQRGARAGRGVRPRLWVTGWPGERTPPGPPDRRCAPSADSAQARPRRARLAGG